MTFYDGGNLINELTLNVKSETIITLPIKKSGYTFEGWLINGIGIPIVGSYTVNNDVSFHAVFFAYMSTQMIFII
ncbi:MAG: hypothetical protein LBH45_03795 [Campylobacteraceae bacterium]|nr:hypothetical protein [Campylobacteraceae bacterium]